MSEKLKIYFITLGCKVNSRDSDGVGRLFFERGYVASNSLSDADVIYINSCTVTSEGAAKSRRALARARRENKKAVIIFGGCLSQTEPFGYAEADIVTGNTNRSAVIELTEQYLQEKKSLRAVAPHTNDEIFEPLPTGGDGHTRAFLKVQDGCPRRCTYCIVSTARGRARSAVLEEAVTASLKLVQEGHKEIVLCGINLSCYEHEGRDLTDLCRAIADSAHPPARLRLGSLEPDRLTEKFIENLSKCKILAPHFHISLQSGSDTVLARMGRFYDTDYYKKVVEMLREKFDNPSFTTDIMVGFPSETEKEFLETCDFVREIGFLRAHVFRYSKRDGTAAAAMGGQLTNAEKKERAHRLSQVVHTTGEEVGGYLLSLPDTFIAETERENGYFDGTTGRYLKLVATAKGLKKGDILLLCDLDEFNEKREDD